MKRPDEDLVTRIRALLGASEGDTETEPSASAGADSARAAIAVAFADGGRADVYVFDTGAAASAARAAVRDGEPAPAGTAVNGALLLVLSGEHESGALRRRVSRFAGKE